jgi:hypothetical protein
MCFDTENKRFLLIVRYLLIGARIQLLWFFVTEQTFLLVNYAFLQFLEKNKYLTLGILKMWIFYVALLVASYVSLQYNEHDNDDLEIEDVQAGTNSRHKSINAYK